MKKLLFVLAIGAFAACGSGTGDTTTNDTTSTMMDTTTVAPVMPDTTMGAMDTTHMMGDTTSKM